MDEALRSALRSEGSEHLLSKLMTSTSIRSPRDALTRTNAELIEACGRLPEAMRLLRVSASAIAPDAYSADFSHPAFLLPSGLAPLDSALGGGLPAGVTEVVGTAGSGKSQLCMLAACSAAAAGKPVAFVDAEDKLNVQRLADIASDSLSNGDTVSYEQIIDAIILYQPQSASECNALLRDLPLSLSPAPALVVLDSAAALPRQDFSSEQLSERMDVITDLAASLTSLASKLACPVIAVNQVAESGGGTASAESDERELIPALGRAYSHCASTRIALDRGTLAVVTSPRCAPIAWSFEIGSAGPRIIPDSSFALPPQVGSSLRLSSTLMPASAT
jgi:RecA/RadA recombinase